MGLPQFLICVLYGLSLLIAANKHGQMEIKRYNFPESLLSIAIIFGLLIWGGFFV